MKKDDRFYLLKRVVLKVPQNYTHQNQLGRFQQYRKKFCYWNTGITDINFARVSQKLIPGKTYIVEFYGINTRVPDNECLEFLKSQNAILTGAQGITLFWELQKREFPLSKYTVSLDEKDALWKDKTDQISKAAGIARSPGDRWGLQVFFSGYKLQKGSCLLCFKADS